MKNNLMKKVALMLIIVVLLIFAIISINHLINLKEPLKMNNTSLVYEKIEKYEDMQKNGIIYLVFIGSLTIGYILLFFNHKNKESFEFFKNKKVFIGSIIIVSVLAFLIIPNNSQDIYYYLSVGRLDSRYGVNSYEQKLEEVQGNYLEDEIVQSSEPLGTTFVYGPLWYLICKIFGKMPINSSAMMMVIFKLCILMIHLLNTYLIYKTSRNKNKIRNTLIYALNPLIIFEGLINAHNDVFLLNTVLFAFYFKKKDKIPIAVLFLSLGALIKYVPIILLPFVIEKEKSKIKKGLYVLELILTYVIIGTAILGTTKGLTAFMAQTEIYMNSIYLIFFMNPIINENVLAIIGKVIFAIIYLLLMIYMYFIKNKENEEFRGNIYTNIIILFLLLVITNFRAWYFIWLFVMIPFLSKEKIDKIIIVSIILELANFIMYGISDDYSLGVPYFIITLMVSSVVIFLRYRNDYKISAIR